MIAICIRALDIDIRHLVDIVAVSHFKTENKKQQTAPVIAKITVDTIIVGRIFKKISYVFIMNCDATRLQ